MLHALERFPGVARRLDLRGEALLGLRNPGAAEQTYRELDISRNRRGVHGGMPPIWAFDLDAGTGGAARLAGLPVAGRFNLASGLPSSGLVAD